MTHLSIHRFTGVRWAVAVALAACGLGCTGADDDALSRIREQGFVRAGYAQEPPFAFGRTDGIVDGESPAALRAALRVMEVDSVRWVRLDFDDLLDALDLGRVDVVASGIFVTPEWSERIRFSRPTACARAALAFRSGTPPPRGLEEFSTETGGRIAVVYGTVEHQATQRLSTSADQVVAVPDLATGLTALRNGSVRALALTAPTLRRVVDRDSVLEMVVYDPPFEVAELVSGCSALAFRKGDAGLAAAVDRGLDAYVGSPEHTSLLDSLELDGWASFREREEERAP